MWRRLGGWLAPLLLAATPTWAQLLEADPDWKDTEVGPAPAFAMQRLIVVDAPASALRIGVDPATLSITPQGVVRYVVVATSNSGAVNAMYEGIRCSTGEFITYARHNPDSGWQAVGRPQWRSMFEKAPSRHPLLLARAGLCQEAAPNAPVAAMVRDLRSTPGSRLPY